MIYKIKINEIKKEMITMANIARYKKTAVGNMFAHYERRKDENGNYRKMNNQNIDPERTPQNYNLGPVRNETSLEYLQNRLSNVYCLNRKDVNVIADWVVTLPKEFPVEKEKEFFKQCYEFYKNIYGEENIISAFVHKDEVTPHMHFCFMPIVKTKEPKRKNLGTRNNPIYKFYDEKLCYDEMHKKKFLIDIHQNLSKHLENYFGFDTGFLNGATRDGNKTVEQLKRESKLEYIEELKQEKNQLTQQNDQLSKELEIKKSELAKAQELIEKDVNNYKLSEQNNNIISHLNAAKSPILNSENVMISKKLRDVIIKQLKKGDKIISNVDLIYKENNDIKKELKELNRLKSDNYELRKDNANLKYDYNELEKEYIKLERYLKKIPPIQLKGIIDIVERELKQNKNNKHKSVEYR